MTMTLNDWLTLRGDNLEQAILAARWYAHPNATVGWVISVSPVPDDGRPELGGFLSEAIARHIVEAHNAGLQG